ncbi:MAG TPA: hypothetical protein VF859_10420 [Burkholderiales bacterium]
MSKNYRVHVALSRDTPLKVGMTVEVNFVDGRLVSAEAPAAA